MVVELGLPRRISLTHKKPCPTDCIGCAKVPALLGTARVLSKKLRVEAEIGSSSPGVGDLRILLLLLQIIIIIAAANFVLTEKDFILCESEKFKKL